MNRNKIILCALFLASVALNARMYILFSNTHDDFVVSMSDTMLLENKVLQHLSRSEIELAKSTLTKSVGNKALYIGICIESECVSKEALVKLSAKP
ncbi:MAG: hypothetical protein JKY48_09680 [Flavobacteriales bacterium]|nr:hypothetical protein [Flavobacteriales bacterium]